MRLSVTDEHTFLTKLDILPRLKHVGFLCGTSKYMVFEATCVHNCFQLASDTVYNPFRNGQCPARLWLNQTEASSQFFFATLY